MPYFVVSYDLRARRNYEVLWEEFERLGGFKPLESVYFVELDDGSTAKELSDHLQSFIDDDDGLLVVEFDKRPAAYKCKSGTANWLKENFS